MLRGVRAAFLVGLCAASVRAPAKDFYVAVGGTSGTGSGTGTLANPWNLATAFAAPASVLPGDSIWLRGGTYTGRFLSLLAGSSVSPIRVRPVSRRARADRRRAGAAPSDAFDRRPVRLVRGARDLLVGREEAFEPERIGAHGPEPGLLHRHRAGHGASGDQADQHGPARRDGRDRFLREPSGRRDLRQSHLRQRLGRGDGPGARERRLRAEPHRQQAHRRQPRLQQLRRGPPDLRERGGLPRQHRGDGQRGLRERIPVGLRLRAERPVRRRPGRDEREDPRERVLPLALGRGVHRRRRERRATTRAPRASSSRTTGSRTGTAGSRPTSSGRSRASR